MRISDWSSDVCSSDLFGTGACNQGNCLSLRVRNGSGFLRRFPPGNGCYAASIPPQRQELRGRADRQSYWRFRTSLGRCGRADGEAACLARVADPHWNHVANRAYQTAVRLRKVEENMEENMFDL